MAAGLAPIGCVATVGMTGSGKKNGRGCKQGLSRKMVRFGSCMTVVQCPQTQAGVVKSGFRGGLGENAGGGGGGGGEASALARPLPLAGGVWDWAKVDTSCVSWASPVCNATRRNDGAADAMLKGLR